MITLMLSYIHFASSCEATVHQALHSLKYQLSGYCLELVTSESHKTIFHMKLNASHKINFMKSQNHILGICLVL